MELPHKEIAELKTALHNLIAALDSMVSGSKLTATQLTKVDTQLADLAKKFENKLVTKTQKI
jgi:hypothetical protein